MDKKIIEYLENLIRNLYGMDVSINDISLISTKTLRTVYCLDTIIESNPVRFVLHIRQKPYRTNQEEEFEAIKTALLNGVPTFELIHYDISKTNPFGATFLLETHIKGDNFIDRKDWFKLQPHNLFNCIAKLHHIKCERKSTTIPDFIFLPKYRNECLLNLKKSARIDVLLLEKMFEEVFCWQKDIDFSIHTSLLHGDLHYSNIIINAENIFYLIDWEMSSVGDYCIDLAYFKARTLDYLYPEENGSLFQALLNYYRKTFNEEDFDNRMRYYLSYRYLEIIWKCCFPKLNEQWLSFYFERYCEFRKSIL